MCVFLFTTLSKLFRFPVKLKYNAYVSVYHQQFIFVQHLETNKLRGILSARRVLRELSNRGTLKL